MSRKTYIDKNSPFLINDPRQKRWAVPYTYEVINIRTQVLLANNLKYIKNKRVLDLGCHFGTFAYIALKLGASYIEGIDSDPALIQQANQYFQEENIDKSTYQFICNEAIAYIESLPDNSFDTVLCLGLLYFIPNPGYLIQQISRVCKETAIIDTFTAYNCLLWGKDAAAIRSRTKMETFDLPLLIFKLTKENKKMYKLPFQFKAKNKEICLVSYPTISLLETYFKSCQFTMNKLSWSKYIVNKNKNIEELISMEGKQTSHWTDIYSTKARISYLLSKV
ncbi:MAG: hypothetical protein A2Y40_00615 [Candidatus Margulisbacteria bacterium GWF2_35_9]|nr:MAG: hypothetical protein A2Y40_00615 [Candidatus Margulisbacteria bacterium GWF2_35_9]